MAGGGWIQATNKKKWGWGWFLFFLQYSASSILRWIVKFNFSVDTWQKHCKTYWCSGVWTWVVRQWNNSKANVFPEYPCTIQDCPFGNCFTVNCTLHMSDGGKKYATNSLEHFQKSEWNWSRQKVDGMYCLWQYIKRPDCWCNIVYYLTSRNVFSCRWTHLILIFQWPLQTQTRRGYLIIIIIFYFALFFRHICSCFLSCAAS